MSCRNISDHCDAAMLFSTDRDRTLVHIPATTSYFLSSRTGSAVARMVDIRNTPIMNYRPAVVNLSHVA